MKSLTEEVRLKCPAEDIWAILSDISRCDWVPSVDKIIVEDDKRSFDMDGMGQITEKILKIDHVSMTLQYSAIQTPAPIEHHLATIKISTLNNTECLLIWTTEIAPEIFANSIHHGMLQSIEGIKKVI
ncbi:MAG: MxaD family protein [Gammaproteobacteria bacterium]|nr:MxaD family protein [Gammaproteobacteria bacterium]